MKKTLYSDESKIIAAAILNIRKKAGLTQRELAEKLGRVHSIIAQIELGERRVDLAEFYWICSACDVVPHKEGAKILKAFSELNGA